jgi:hypothetical protein
MARETQQQANGEAVFEEKRPERTETAILTASTCILCHERPGKGRWEICDECRRKLATNRTAKVREYYDRQKLSEGRGQKGVEHLPPLKARDAAGKAVASRDR